MKRGSLTAFEGSSGQVSPAGKRTGDYCITLTKGMNKVDKAVGVTALKISGHCQ
jgi:hypothetical protein